MSRVSLADAKYADKRKKTRREVFLGEMKLVLRKVLITSI